MCVWLCSSGGFVCFCKQKMAYDMRISDVSSDGCSSDRHAHGFAKGIERLEAGFEVAAIIEDRGILFIVAQHRHDDDLVRRDARRTAQAVVIAVGHDDGADGARRKAPTDGMAEAVAEIGRRSGKARVCQYV